MNGQLTIDIISKIAQIQDMGNNFFLKKLLIIL